MRVAGIVDWTSSSCIWMLNFMITFLWLHTALLCQVASIISSLSDLWSKCTFTHFFFLFLLQELFGTFLLLLMLKMQMLITLRRLCILLKYLLTLPVQLWIESTWLHLNLFLGLIIERVLFLLDKVCCAFCVFVVKDLRFECTGGELFFCFDLFEFLGFHVLDTVVCKVISQIFLLLTIRAS